ncbi:MAG: signal peptidase I [Jatrophihabitantaceae bacterium]
MDEEKNRARRPASTPEGQSPDPDPADDPDEDPGPDPSSAALRRLDPARPWLTTEPNRRLPETVAPLAAGEDGPTRLQPIRPWLKQNRPERSVDAKPQSASAREQADGADSVRSSPRSELSHRLSAPPPDQPAEPAIVPIASSASMRPTIAWDEVDPPGTSSDAPEPALAAEPAEPESAAESESAAVAEPEHEGVAEPADPDLPRPRPRPYVGAPARTDEPAAQQATPAIASGTAPSSLVRAQAPQKDDFFTRADEGPDDKSSKPVKGSGRGVRRLVRTGVILAIAVLAAVLLRVYVVAPYYIPSASMEPTLHGCSSCNNDHVLVDKLSYRMHDIHRGDVVVFHRPSTWQVSENTLIKRVVGLPGDRLRVADGKLFVNGLLLQEPYTNPKCPSMRTLAESPAKPASTFGPVPNGEVYVMGDNRCDSSDSRAFGPVPESKVVGRAFVIFWPLGRIHFL